MALKIQSAKLNSKELEGNINDPDQYRGVEYQLAEDCLRAALNARGLELPRTEVEGRFQEQNESPTKLGINSKSYELHIITRGLNIGGMRTTTSSIACMMRLKS